MQCPGLKEHFHAELISQSGPDYWGVVVVVHRSVLLQLFYHDKDIHICQPVAQSTERQVPPGDDKLTSKMASFFKAAPDCTGNLCNHEKALWKTSFYQG